MAKYRETEVAAKLHIQRKVLYNIKQKGLISPSTTELHESMEYNFYDDETVTQLWLILRYREFGYSYADIKKMFDSPARDRNMMLREVITRLDHMKQLAEIIYETGVLPPDFMEMHDIMDEKYFNCLSSQESMNNGREMMEHLLNDEEFNKYSQRITDLYRTGRSESDPEIQKAVSNILKIIKKYTSPTGARNILKTFGNLFTAEGNIQLTTGMGEEWIRNIGRAFLWYVKNETKEEE